MMLDSKKLFKIICSTQKKHAFMCIQNNWCSLDTACTFESAECAKNLTLPIELAEPFAPAFLFDTITIIILNKQKKKF